MSREGVCHTRLEVFTPFQVQLGNFAPILLETEHLGYEIRDHENRASRDPDYLDRFPVRIIGLDFVATESPSKLQEPRRALWRSWKSNSTSLVQMECTCCVTPQALSSIAALPT